VNMDRFQEELDRFLVEKVVFLESRSFSFGQIEENEINNTKKSILARIKKNPVANKQWEALQLSSEEISDLIKQKIASQKFIQFKTKSSFVPVTDAEALTYYRNNKKKYEGKDYKQVKETIRKSLAKEQAQQRLADWYDILRKKYEVTKVISVGQ